MKLFTAGLAAAVAAVSLLPGVAIAVPKFVGIEAGKVKSTGHAPSADVVIKLQDLYKPVKKTVNACGFAEINAVASGTNYIYYQYTGSKIQPQNTQSGNAMAIGTAPKCVNGQYETALPAWTLAASLPKIYRTPDNRFFQTGLTSGAIVYTAKVTGGVVDLISSKAKANTCGIASHNLLKTIQTYSTNTVWADDNGMPVEIVGSTEMGNIGSQSQFLDSDGNPLAIAAPVCRKNATGAGILYVKAPI